MSKIANLKQYDIVLSYSYGYSQRTCTGHLFECIEYFHILKDHFNVGIMIGDCVDFESIIANILDKYTFTSDEVEFLLDNIHIHDNPNIVLGKKLLLVDGNFKRLKNKVLRFDNIYCFPCGVRTAEDYPEHVTILGDERIYDFVDVHYRKKMLLSKIKKETSTNEFDYMMYLTEGPRELSNEQIDKIIERYPGKSFVIYTDYHISLKDKSVKIEHAPVENVWKFKTYLYTSIERQFDCSPRFIVECKMNNVGVEYDLNYPMSNDKGLFYRNLDMKRLENVELLPTDSIISLLKIKRPSEK